MTIGSSPCVLTSPARWIPSTSRLHLLFVALLACEPVSSRAATLLEAGGWAADQVWTNQGSPYVVQDGYSVANLSIDPGVVVKIRGTLSVTGDFAAVGTAAEPIVITCLTDDTIGGDQDGIPTDPTTDPEAVLSVGGTSQTTTIEHLQCRWIGGVWITSRGPNSAYHPGEVYEASVRDVSFTHCSAGMNVTGGRTMDGYFLPWSLTTDGLIVEGVRQDGVSSTIYGLSCVDLAAISLLNARIQDCQIGVHIISGDVTVRDSIIAHNDIGLRVVRQGVTLVNNSIRHNINSEVTGPDQTIRPDQTVTATANWWGDPSGPREPTLNPEGLGNAVSATVFDPPLAQPPDFDDAAPTITTTSLRDMSVGFHQSRKLEAQGAYVRYGWTWEPVPPFTLPAGLQLSQDGVISGTSTSQGSYTFIVTATDGSGRSGSREMTLSITQADSNSSLRGWWKFDDGSGGAAIDSSGSGNHGTLQEFNLATAWVEGKSGTALDFDGLSTYVNVGNAPELNPAEAMTISAWIKPHTYGVSVAAIVERRYGSSYILYITGSGENFIFDVNGVTVESDVGLITLNEWNHVAVVFDAGTVTFYSNGSPVDSWVWGEGIPVPSSINQDDFDVQIGNDSTFSSPFDGLIDDVRIYDTALTQEQVGFIMANPNIELPHTEHPPLQMTAWHLPLGCLGTSYSVTFQAEGGAPPYKWSLAEGSTLPAGLHMNDAGELTGTPEEAGYFSIVVTLSDSSRQDLARALTLRVVPTAALSTIRQEPLQLSFGAIPRRAENKDHLVLITHGWTLKEDDQIAPPNPDWVDNLASTIDNYLAATASDNWQVATYKWAYDSWISWPTLLITHPFRGVLPKHDVDEILTRASTHGTYLGRQLASDNWKHVHLVAHSAGSALIQAASEAIQADPRAEDTVIHTTFLDAYVGFTYSGRTRYGRGATFADHYMAYDWTTFDPITARTASRLRYSHNVEVSWLDPNKTIVDSFKSNPFVGEICTVTTTSHSWPHQFYLQTARMSWGDAEGYGFTLSKEGGGWERAKELSVDIGNAPHPLGDADECVRPEWDWYTDVEPFAPVIDFLSPMVPTIHSPSGTSSIDGAGIVMSTGSPVWIAALLPISNLVNAVSVETRFLDAPTTGVLSVHWNGTQIGSVDGRAVASELQRYVFRLPGQVHDGEFVLGFRYDPFSEVMSNVLVTNVAFGLLSEEVGSSLRFSGQFSDGLPVLELIGEAGFSYTVEASSNLVEWRPLTILINTTGSVLFIDRTHSNYAARFYRSSGPL